MLQEHRRKGQGRIDFEDWLTKRNLVPVVGDAYYKNNGLGGGTAITAPNHDGLRPAPGGDTIAEGRVVVGIADICGDVAIGSVYAISSAPVSRQIALWKELALYLTTLGLPFVLGGDWHVAPKHLRDTGLLDV